MFLILCRASPCAISVQEKLPDANETMAKFLAKSEKDSRYLVDNFTHEEIELTTDLKDGTAVRREEKRYFVVKNGGNLFKKLLSIDGIPVTDSGFEPKKEVVLITPNFFARYAFVLKGSEVLNGEKTRVFSFTPKKNLPEERREDKIFNNLAGEVWISQKTLDFKKLTAHLLEEVSFAWTSFIGGKLQKADCSVDAGLVDGRFAIICVRVEFKYSARAFFWPINGHSIKIIHYQNYERRKQ